MAVELVEADGEIVGAELTAPEPLSRRDTTSAEQAAALPGPDGR